MKKRSGGGKEKLEREVAIGRCVETVLGQPRETKLFRDRRAIERDAAARQRSAPERHRVGRRSRAQQTFAVPGEHLEIGEQVVSPQHRLSAAHMGVSGQHQCGTALRLGD